MPSLTSIVFGTGVLAMVLATTSPASPIEGVWAGDRMIFTATAAGAHIETDCASGSIAGPLHPDKHGRFQVMGAFQRYRPGARPKIAATLRI